MVHKIGGDLKFRILTGRMQGVDASDTPVADYGSIPRDGENPALTPGYALPPGIDTPEGSEPTASFGRGWIAFLTCAMRGEPISSFRTIERATGTRDAIRADGLSVPGDAGPYPDDARASPTVGTLCGRRRRVLVGRELVCRRNVRSSLSRRARTGQRRGRADRLFDLVRRQRAHFDYRCGFEGLSEADLPVYHVRELSRCGEVLAAYGIKQCTDYPAANATGFETSSS